MEPRRSAPGRSSRKARLAAERQRQRRVRWVAIGAVAVVVVTASVMVVVSLTGTSAPSSGSSSAGRAGQLVQRVPVSVLDAVGAGNGITSPQALPAGAPVLEQDGKPEVLYIGAEYCPFCAVERWPLVVALGRFGTFTNLGGTESAAEDRFPRTQTFTFHGAGYTSDVVSFVPVETNTNQPDPAGGYTPLDPLTAEQQAILQRYDAVPYTSSPGAIPFLMIGNRFVSVGASYDPTILQGMTRDQIAEALSDPSSPIAQGVDAAANRLTAAICQATDGKPSSVCSDPTIANIGRTLPTSR